MTRPVVALLSFALLAAPAAAEGQSRKMHRVGYLSFSPAERVKHLRVAFQQGLRELGYVEVRTSLLSSARQKGTRTGFPDWRRHS